MSCIYHGKTKGEGYRFKAVLLLWFAISVIVFAFFLFWIAIWPLFGKKLSFWLSVCDAVALSCCLGQKV